MPGLRSLVARRRSILASPPYISVPTPPHSQQNSPCAEESSPSAGRESNLSLTQIEVNGDVPNESQDSPHAKEEKSNYSEVIVSAQEKEASGKVSEIASDVQSSCSSDTVIGREVSGDKGANKNDKETEKTQTGNQLSEDQVIVNNGGSVTSREAKDNECFNETKTSPGLRTQACESVVNCGKKSAMEIESTLAKRGVTIVRRLVDCKDIQAKSKTEVTPAKDSPVSNGTVVNSKSLIPRKDIESRLGRLGNLKGTSITVNSRAHLGQPLRGGATVNRNPVGRPPIHFRDAGQRNTYKAKGAPFQPGLKGPRYQNPSGFPTQSTIKGVPAQISVSPSLRPSFPRDAPSNKNLGPSLDIKRTRGIAPVSSANNVGGDFRTQRTISSSSAHGSVSKDSPNQGSSAFPSPKSLGDYADPRKGAPYSSPRRTFSQAGSPQSWSTAAGARPFTQHQRSVTPSPLSRGTIPSPQSRSSAMSPQSCSTTSPQSSTISPRSNSSIPSPQSRATGNYQARSAETSPYSRTQEISPAARSAEASPQSKASELSPSSRSAEVSPLSRTSDMSPLSRSVEASPQHRSSGITPQTRYPVGFSPQARSTELSPSVRPSSARSHTQSSPPGVSPKSQMIGLTSQPAPAASTSSLSTAQPISAGQLPANSVAVPPHSSLGLLTQQINSVGLPQGSLPFGPLQQTNPRIPGPLSSMGFMGLHPTSGFAARSAADDYSTGTSKFPAPSTLEGYSTQITPGGFPLHSNSTGFPAPTDLPGFPSTAPSCGFAQPTNTVEFPAQSSGGIPEQLNPETFTSHPVCTGFPNQTNSGYPPHTSSGGFGINSSTSEYHESSSDVLGYQNSRTFPIHASTREYSTYSTPENAPPQEISNHTSPRELPVTHNSRDVLQTCSQGLPLNPTTGDSMSSLGQESQVQSNYSETLVHPVYHDQNTFPRSNQGDLSTLPDFRDPLRQSYREPDLMPGYRPDTIQNSFQDTPLQESPRNSQTVPTYRDLPIMPGMNDIQSQTSPRGTALHNTYKEQPLENNYREHNLMGNYVESPALANFREPVNQTVQRDQPLPSFSETISHTSPREQVLPGFRETLDQTTCREQLLPGYRETLDHTSPREQALPSFSETVNHTSPRGEVLPSFSESLNPANLRSQVIPGFSDTVTDPSPRMQSHPSYREPIDYTSFRDPINHSSHAEPSLQPGMRETVQYNSEYPENANQNHTIEPSHTSYPEFRGNTQVTTTSTSGDLKYKDTGQRNPYTESVLPSFTESFECATSGDYRKENSMLHSFGESSGYISTRRTSDSRYDESFSACAQSSSYSPTYSSEPNSPDGSDTRNSPEGEGEQPMLATSQDSLLCTQTKVTPSNEMFIDNQLPANQDKQNIEHELNTQREGDSERALRRHSNSLDEPRITDTAPREICENPGSVDNTKQSQSTNIKIESPGPSAPIEGASMSDSPTKYATVGSPSKLNAGSSPSSQERIVIKMKLLHSDARSDNEKHKRGENADETKMRPEGGSCVRFPNVKYTRWTIDSIINGREDGTSDEVSGKENKTEPCSTEEEEEEPSKDIKSSVKESDSPNVSGTSTNLDTNKNLMKSLKITIPLRTRIHPDGLIYTRKMDNNSVTKESTVDNSPPGSSRVTRSSNKLELESLGKTHNYPIRKLKLKNIPLASPAPKVTCSGEGHTSPVSASLELYKKRRRRRRKSRRNSETSDDSDSSVTSVVNEDNDDSVVAQMKKCSIVIKRIYSAGNNSCYSSSLCSKRSSENTEPRKPGRPKRKAAVEANERCHKSLRSLDTSSESKSNKIPYNGAFCKGSQLVSVNLTENNVDKNRVITQCSVILYDVFMNRRINSMVCPGCSRNYDSSDSVQVNISKATISLLCSVCQWLVVKDVHPQEVQPVAPS